MYSLKNVFVIYGPSGSGQDSVIEGLQKILPLERVVTTTTRPMRPTESQGNPYYFVSKEEFEKNIREGKMLEQVQKYDGVYYGVTEKDLARVASGKRIGIWKVDFEGARNLKKRFPELMVLYISASLEILEQRIRRRDNPSEEYIQTRLKHIKEWTPKSIYDYKIENEQGKLEETIEKTRAIIQKHAHLAC